MLNGPPIQFLASHVWNSTISSGKLILHVFAHDWTDVMANDRDDMNAILARFEDALRVASAAQKAVADNELRLAQSQEILSENQRFMSESQQVIASRLTEVVANQRTIIGNQATIIENQNTIITFLKMLVHGEA